MISKCLALLVVSSVLCLAYGLPNKTTSSTTGVERTKRQVLLPRVVEVLPNPYLNPLLLGRKKRQTEDVEIVETDIASKTNVTEEISRNKRQIPLVPRVIEVLPSPYLNPLVLGRKKRDLSDQLLSLSKDPKIADLASQIDMDQFQSLLNRKKRQVPLYPQIIEVISSPYLNPLVLGRKRRQTDDVEIVETDKASKTNVTEEITRNKRQIPLVPQVVEIIEPSAYLNPLVLGRKKRQVPLYPQIIEVLPSPYLNPLVLGRK